MKKIYIMLLLDFIYAGIVAQVKDIHSSVGIEGILATQNYLPFWLRSDQFGSIPLSGSSVSFLGNLRKEYDSAQKHLVDWSASLEARANVGKRAEFILIEGYGKIHVSVFELMLGRTKDIMGLVDTSLSSGAFAISGNALGIPKIQVSIPDYYRIPFWGGIFSFKGNFAHGWIGQAGIQTGDRVKMAQTYFEQASFYGKFGKPLWKFKLDGGFNHQVIWGSERSIFGESFKLSTLKSYEYVILGKTYQGSKIGNHLGSIDLGMEYDFDKIKIMVYRQNFYDEGALFHLANLRDGLNGLSILNKRHTENNFKWRKMLFEVFYSKDQAGYPWSKRTPSGDEDYYNNYEYIQGWSYKGLGLGNPLITPGPSTRAGLPNESTDYFNNNRVIAAYWGMEASFKNWDFKSKFSFSWNYGTFGTSPWGHSTGSIFFPPRQGLFKEINEFSSYLEVKKALKRGLNVGCVVALDAGGLFYNSGGIIFKISKAF